MIVAATTTTTYKAKAGEATRWLANADAMLADYPDLRFFCALERGAPGDDLASADLRLLLDRVGGALWEFSIDDGSGQLDNAGRIARICVGRNLGAEYALRVGATHVLWLDSDLEPPGDAVTRLLALDWPIVGGHVPSYCLAGAKVQTHPRTGDAFTFPVENHWNTAGFLLVAREVYARVRWRHDMYTGGDSDDPCYAADAAALGYETLVRKDVVADHRPLVPLERRGHDLRLAPAVSKPPTVVVIPVRDNLELTRAIVAQLLDQGEADRIVVFDNGSIDGTREWLYEIADEQPGLVEAVDANGLPFYRMWNAGWLRACQLADGGPVNVAFLNNDIAIPPRFLSTLAAALRSDDTIWLAYPDYTQRVAERVLDGVRLMRTRGTYREGGMCGWAFMLRGEKRGELPPIDEQFEIWYGDDDLAYQVEKLGGVQVRVLGLPVDHQGEATVSRHAWTADAKTRDAERFRAKYGARA